MTTDVPFRRPVKTGDVQLGRCEAESNHIWSLSGGGDHHSVAGIFGLPVWQTELNGGGLRLSSGSGGALCKVLLPFLPLSAADPSRPLLM
jgi:hypothetical protein